MNNIKTIIALFISFLLLGGVCLAGEQCRFFDKYMARTFGEESFPLSYEEGFGEEVSDNIC